jgi:hypothetical protein
MQVLHSFILLLFILSIYRHNDEMMDEGIAYLGPIMMWYYIPKTQCNTTLNWQWTKFLQYPHVELGITQNITSPTGILCFKCRYCIILFNFVIFLNFFFHNNERMDEGIAYLGPIMM